MTAPLPLYRAVSKPFWDGLRQGKLTIQRCEACRRFVFYPRPFCHHCSSSDVSWTEIPPHGTLYSFTESHTAPSPDFRDSWPRLPAVVELAPHVRMATTLIGLTPADVRIGMDLRLVFPDAGTEHLLPPSFTSDAV